MARPTLQDFQDRNASHALVFYNGTTATGTLLGQLRDLDWTAAKQARDTYRVGDSSRHTVYTAVDCDWNMTLYEDPDAQEIFLLWGGDAKPSAGGWAGTESVELSVDDTGVTITIANYAYESAGSALLWTETFTDAVVQQTQRRLEGNTENMWTFQGRADTIIGAPVGAMGA